MKTRKGVRNLFSLRVLRILALLFISLSPCCQALSVSSPSDEIPPEAENDFALIAEAWNAIHAHYVDRSTIEANALTYGAISGMVAALGDTDHSTFLSPDMIKEEEKATVGVYKGIGAEVQMKGGRVVVVAPMDGSPAQKAGLQPGQIILKVDGRDVTGLSLPQVVDRIAGPEGTKVTLTILHPETEAVQEVTLVRAVITLEKVSWNRLPGTEVAHLRVVRFSQGVTKGLKEALESIRQQGMRGIILDLRNNPGGVLTEAVSVASQFLSEGNVLLEKDSEGTIKAVPAEEGGVALHIPVVCLVNSGTASAAEIVAGALQDHRRATLVGTKTFGTGTVLRRYPLSDGSALLLAVQEWLTPDGHTIWHNGLTPDVVVTLPEGAKVLLPLEEKDMTAEQLRESKDLQVLEALALLTTR